MARLDRRSAAVEGHLPHPASQGPERAVLLPLPDPVMLPFRSIADIGRAAGHAGRASRAAAEVVTKYMITDMYAKAVQGMPAEDAVKWAHAELVKIYA